MIKKESFSIEHTKEYAKMTHTDPSLVERSIYAFGLLEALVRVGMPLIFKGGTSLMLLLEHPGRLSTDIDIIVEPGTDIAHYLDLAAVIFPFKTQFEQTRMSKNNIEKKHYKFVYDSPIMHKNNYILLDVLFERNHYSSLIERQIRNDLLMTEEPYYTVKLPNINSVLGDKLTAFAPHTIGKLIGISKDLEIMKQLFDIITLIKVFDDFNEVYSSYMGTVKTEIGYRDNQFSIEDCLMDTIEAAACVISEGTYNSADYKVFSTGMRNLRDHIYGEKFNGNTASRDSCALIYMAACILKHVPFHRIDNPEDYRGISIKDTKYKALAPMEKNALPGYGYIVEALRLLDILDSKANKQ